ncbi:MAG: sn-glycerol-3-phosphate ABC transporter ATP-binding protein UgpC [Gammaproteobacteria bacterium]|nr:sn-glycerol-3-phosphate ABC transporter ATP-binding protein UgpC [Gammaproteobacteria bacterium]MDE2250608.1 sn-glycerol-3-phosphate ABC transporter ATP-binding protein UgpC [Gammaproteobacteria bacterium]
MAAVRLHQVRKVYDDGQAAVAGASFQIGDGELVALVGPSGCGKSTLLRMIAGLESITSGTLHIGDRLVNDVAPRDRDVAMVFQSYALYPHMSVRENLAFGLRLRGTDAASIDAQVRAAAATLELDELLERKPRALSGGQRQRVALGRALVRNPQVFLLDEPLSNLDAKLRLSMRAEIGRLHRRLRATMLYVTHDQIEAMTLGERIVVLNAGEIQQIDTPMNLYSEPANLFVAGFLGSPAMNFFRGRLTAAPRAQLQCEGAALPLPAAHIAVPALASVAGEVIVGLRPEDLAVAPPGTAGSGEFTIDATVESIEPVGNEIFLGVQFGGAARICRVPPQSLPEPGRPVRLCFTPGKLRYFDAASGVRLR